MYQDLLKRIQEILTGDEYKFFVLKYGLDISDFGMNRSFTEMVTEFGYTKNMIQQIRKKLEKDPILCEMNSIY